MMNFTFPERLHLKCKTTKYCYYFYFLGQKVTKYKHLQIWINLKTHSKPDVFSMVLFVKS